MTISTAIVLRDQPRGQVRVPEGDSLILATCDDTLILLSTVGGRTTTTVADREGVNTYDDPAIAGWCGYCDCAVIRCHSCVTTDCAMHMEDEDAEGNRVCSACYDDLHPYCGLCDAEHEECD